MLAPKQCRTFPQLFFLRTKSAKSPPLNVNWHWRIWNGRTTGITLKYTWSRCLIYFFSSRTVHHLPVELLNLPAFRKYVNNSPPTTYSNSMYKQKSLFVCQILWMHGMEEKQKIQLLSFFVSFVFPVLLLLMFLYVIYRHICKAEYHVKPFFRFPFSFTYQILIIRTNGLFIPEYEASDAKVERRQREKKNSWKGLFSFIEMDCE